MYLKSRKAFAGSGAVLALMIGAAPMSYAAEVDSATRAKEWIHHFGFSPPEASLDGLCAPSGRELPTFTVTPAATGRQLVRVSLPFAPGTFPVESGLVILAGDRVIPSAVRPLTYHPGRPQSMRRAIITFVYDFPSPSACSFRTVLKALPRGQSQVATQPASQPSAGDRIFEGRIGNLDLQMTAGTLQIRREGEVLLDAEFQAPAPKGAPLAAIEIVERNEHYLWVRMLVPDPDWPRILEVRADALGTVAVRGNLQHLQQPTDQRPTAPDFGWRIRRLSVELPKTKDHPLPPYDPSVIRDPAYLRGFGGDTWASLAAGEFSLDFPDAHLHRRGLLAAMNPSDLMFFRCLAREHVPHQLAAWRTATFVLRPKAAVPWTSLLEPPHRVQIPAEALNEIYGSGATSDLAPWPLLSAVTQYHRDAIASCLLPGDDYGNVGSMPVGSAFAMNRLNHGPAIFDEYYRSSDLRLRHVAIEWCANMHDLSIWWGTDKPGQFGGTRYNNMAAHHPEYLNDRSFMWRSDTAVDFCTKGFDAFFYAYEETGDPRMANAFRWQSEYAAEHMHLVREMRDIGDVADFLRLYRFTGKSQYLDQAMRFFRELREHLSPDHLFSQGGQPIVPDVHFIADDEGGYQHPFAKPYIIGYALAGLPALARYYPDEPRLVDVIRAVATFLAGAQDPVGGWPYPHPRSPGVNTSQSIEHAAQIMNAAEYLESRGEPIAPLLDAIERTLQARILMWQRTGHFFASVGSWEQAAGLIKESKDWYERYKRPEDRDRTRDYTEGSIGVGSSPPEGVVYFFRVLSFYLAHRPAERLFHPDDLLQKVMARITPQSRPAASLPTSTDYLRYGMAAFLPTFSNDVIERLTFPLRYDPQRWTSFADWRREARATLLRTLLKPPLRAEFAPVLIAQEDRDGYDARKLVFNVSKDCRVPAYLLVPKGKGPFPAVVALHDHGAFFAIGKEKVVRPFEGRTETIQTAQQWVDKNYGGRFFGDELAKRGYVVLAIDALFWGDRGRKEGVDYTAQQALASNLFQLGMTWLGVITWDDIRSADFLASLPEVDPERIGAMGLSMGSHRTWMLSAASDRIAAGVAVCWMGTTPSLMSPGNNQTKGHSAYSMLAPDLPNELDYPDVASIACPKPMLFYNGEQDGLFPVKGVEEAYATMRRTWQSQGVSEKLVTRVWRRPHVFDVEMQEAAFSWLDTQLKKH